MEQLDRTDEAESGVARSNRRRNLLIGLGVATVAPALAVRAIAGYLRQKPDPEAGEVISERLGEVVRYVESFDGTKIYTEELGSGTTLVMVHGWFCNTDSWHYQKKELNRKYRVICYDQRGHRYSNAHSDAEFSLEALAKDLKGVLDTFSPEGPVVLAGHSMGGMAILKFFEMYPEELGKRIRGIALVDTSNTPLSSAIAGGSLLKVIQKPVVLPLLGWIVEHGQFADRVKGIAAKTSLFLVATRYLGYGSRASLTHMEYIAEMVQETSMEGACRTGLGILEQPEKVPLQALANSGIPVLIWVGEKDKLARPQASKQMFNQLPASELHIIEDTGHPSYMEQYHKFNLVFDELITRAFGDTDGD